MEQIEKALAKAREIRMNSGVAMFPQANGFTGSGANGISPDYSETTVLAADPKRLLGERLVAGSPGHPTSHVYGLLRTQVLHRMKEQGLSTLVVTAPQLGCGTSTTAANLAIAIAMDVNQTVLLVDINLRAPSLHERFQFKPGCGIDDYLRGDVQLSDCLVSPGVPRLVILPARLPDHESAETLRSPRMAALARELKSRYPDRIIIYDAPPLLPSSDTLGFLPNADGVLFVARGSTTTKQDIEKSASLLRNTTVIGTLMNAYDAD